MILWTWTRLHPLLFTPFLEFFVTSKMNNHVSSLPWRTPKQYMWIKVEFKRSPDLISVELTAPWNQIKICVAKLTSSDTSKWIIPLMSNGGFMSFVIYELLVNQSFCNSEDRGSWRPHARWKALLDFICICLIQRRKIWIKVRFTNKPTQIEMVI